MFVELCETIMELWPKLAFMDFYVLVQEHLFAINLNELVSGWWLYVVGSQKMTTFWVLFTH